MFSRVIFSHTFSVRGFCVDLSQIKQSISRFPLNVSIHLEISSFNKKYNHRNCEQLLDVLELFKHLNVVKVTLDDFDTDIRPLLEKLIFFQFLLELNISRYSYNISDVDKESICFFLKSKSSLRVFHFNTTQNFRSVLDAVADAPNIEILRIRGLVIDNFDEIGEHIVKNSNVKCLDLSSNFFGVFSQKGDNEKWERFCQNLSKSSLIHFDFSSNTLTSENRDILFKSVIDCRSLQELKIGEWNCHNMMFETVEKLLGSISLVVFLLHKLKLFSWENVRIYKEDSIGRISQAISTSTSLETLHLDSCDDLMDKGDFYALKNATIRNPNITQSIMIFDNVKL